MRITVVWKIALAVLAVGGLAAMVVGEAVLGTLNRPIKPNELASVAACQPGHETKRFTAPAPVMPQMPGAESFSADVSARLALRGTVNVAGPWLNTARHDPQDYGLVWHSWDSRPRSTRAIWLKELLWAYSYPSRQEDAYWKLPPGLAMFRTGKKWASAAEYGNFDTMAYNDPAYRAYLARVAKEMLKATGADGLLLDWWIDDHPGQQEANVRGARIDLARALRAEVGEGAILMGNVGITRDSATANLMNGAFMELWKHNPADGYSCDELHRFAETMAFYDRALRPPNLVALEPWRITNHVTDNDRMSPANVRMAGVFAALAAAVPRNGYVLYADNAEDTDRSDHDHVFYDVYRRDLGRATSGHTEVAPGIGYRLFERGLVIYNISNINAEVSLPGGTVTVRSVEGLVCALASTGFDCG